MPTYITLANFTDQGARNVRESPDRYEAFKQLAETVGVTVKGAYWTQGAYDVVLITEGPEEAVMLAALATVELGNVRTQTLRGYNAAEMREFTARLG